MHYLTHIETSPYMIWQTTLLHQSLKCHNLGDSLVVAYSGAKPPFPRCFPVRHVGKDWGSVPITKQYAALEAVKTGQVQQPFVLLDPDTFVVSPVQPRPGVTGQVHRYLDRGPLELLYGKLDVNHWHPVAGIIQYNDVDVPVFEEIVTCCHGLAKSHVDGRHRWFLDMVGVACGLGRSECTVTLVDDYESPLDHRRINFNPDANVVHYCNGFLPWFNKREHDSMRPFYVSEWPWERILQMPDANHYIDMMKSLVRSLFAN